MFIIIYSNGFQPVGHDHFGGQMTLSLWSHMRYPAFQKLTL